MQTGTRNSGACENPVKQNQAPDDRRLIIYSVLLVLSTGRRPIRWKSQIFPTPSFTAFVWDDPLRIYGKALRFLKLESSRQPTVKIW